MNYARNLILGMAFSSLIAAVALRRGALSRSGVAGAVIIGTLIFGFGGWVWGALLITFFVLSSLLSRYRSSSKVGLSEKFAKGSRRDLGQVLANGGLGTLLAIAHRFVDHPALFFAFLGTMATVNADTWATELGVLDSKPPRLITTGGVVEPGTSGGISRTGTLAAAAGATLIGLIGWGLWSLAGGKSDASWDGRGAPTGPALLVACVLGGLAGSLVDSLVGATVQAIYYSERRAKETERSVEVDGSPNRLVRGWAWLNNDWVNFLSSAVGAIVGTLVYVLMTPA